jgi:rod shape-determining protein MreD
MRGARGIVVAAVALWFGAVLQQSVGRYGIAGARPDYILVMLSCLCLYASRSGGALAGFFAGLLSGAITGANLTQYIFSRSVAGFADAWARNLGLDANALTAALNSFFMTLVAQLILMFFAPPPGIATFLGATIGSAMVNGVLAVPVHALLRRILGPQGA